MIRRHAIRLGLQWWLVALMTSVLVIGMGIDRTMLRLDNLVYDTLQPLRPHARCHCLLLVEIDNDSMRRVGRWPWNRAVHAALIDRLRGAGARAIAYDVLFTEPSDPGADAQLGASLAGPRGPVFVPMLPVGGGAVLPIGPVRAGARGIGPATIDPDADGVVRSARLADDPVPGARHLIALATGTRPDPAARLIPFGLGRADWSEVPAAAVLAGEVPDEAIRGRIVLVGVTGSGLGSRYPTPTGQVMSGLEIEAHLAQGLLDRAMIRAAPRGAQTAFALAALWLMMLALAPTRGWSAPVVLSVAVGGVLGVCALALGWWGVWVPPGAALAGLLVACPVWGWQQLATIARFMRGELQRFEAEASVLPRARLAPGGSQQGVGAMLGLLESAIARSRDMRRFVADRLDQLPDATLVTDLDGRVVLANAAARALFAGFGRPVVRDIDARALLACLHVAPGEEVIPFPPVGLAPAAFEAQRDQAHVFLVGMAEQTSADGRRAGWVIRFVDVSEAKAAQRQRDDVIQLLTHDMRSPQASILAVLDTAAPDAIAPREAAAIRGYAERTLRLADGFVQLARAENLEYHLEDIDLAEMLLDAIDELWPQSRARQIAIETRGGEDGPFWVRGERSLLTRVLGNLIGNAIKYSPDGSTVTCSLSHTTASDGTVWAHCRVADQGPGMDAALRERMFERFRRGPIGLGPKTSGAGLGLSFVHTVTMRHHGTIACDSAPGEGTAFTLSLPAIA